MHVPHIDDIFLMLFEIRCLSSRLHPPFFTCSDHLASGSEEDPKETIPNLDAGPEYRTDSSTLRRRSVCFLPVGLVLVHRGRLR
jgi:hypothetical protein